MDFDGLLRDEEARRDLSVAKPLSNKAKDVDLPGRQAVIAHVLSQLRRDIWRNTLQPGMDVSNSVDEILVRAESPRRLRTSST